MCIKHCYNLYFRQDISFKHVILYVMSEFPQEKSIPGINRIYFNTLTFWSICLSISSRCFAAFQTLSFTTASSLSFLFLSLSRPRLFANSTLPLVGRFNAGMSSWDDLRTFFGDAQIDIKAARLCHIGHLCRMIL